MINNNYAVSLELQHALSGIDGLFAGCPRSSKIEDGYREFRAKVPKAFVWLTFAWKKHIVSDLELEQVKAGARAFLRQVEEQIPRERHKYAKIALVAMKKRLEALIELL